MAKQVEKKWRLSNQEFDDLQRALNVFTATTSEILEDWFPELCSRDWVVSQSGTITLYAEGTQ